MNIMRFLSVLIALAGVGGAVDGGAGIAVPRRHSAERGEPVVAVEELDVFLSTDSLPRFTMVVPTLVVGNFKRGFTRLYSSWDIHDERFLLLRDCEEHWLNAVLEDEEEATLWLGESWRDVPYERHMYEYWARCYYWKQAAGFA